MPDGAGNPGELQVFSSSGRKGEQGMNRIYFPVSLALVLGLFAWGCTSKNQQEQPGGAGTAEPSPVKESTPKTETLQDEGAFICFPDAVEQ